MTTIRPKGSNQFVLGDNEWVHRGPAQDISAAIDEYPKHIRSESVGETSAPYDAASMAEIYHPRVRGLMDIQSRGATHAAWGRLTSEDTNKWHSVNPDTPPIEAPQGTPGQVRDAVSKRRGARLS